MCRIERWSLRTLTARIDSMLYERTGLSSNPEEVIDAALATLRDEDRMSPELVFKDPYLFDFLGLRDRYLERSSKRLTSPPRRPGLTARAERYSHSEARSPVR